MYLLLLDMLYSLQLWSEQTRQMNRHRLQKLLDEFTDRVFIYLPKTLSMQINFVHVCVVIHLQKHARGK